MHIVGVKLTRGYSVYGCLYLDEPCDDSGQRRRRDDARALNLMRDACAVKILSFLIFIV